MPKLKQQHYKKSPKKRRSQLYGKNQPKRKEQQYGQYYEKMMEPIWQKDWITYQKRIKKLKKDIISLGKIPENEKQLIATIKYFVKLIALVTNFLDTGLSNRVPDDKYQIVSEFDTLITLMVARDTNAAQYYNNSKVNEPVTYDNLYLGMFSEIKEKDITPNTSIRIIGGKPKKIIVPLTSMSGWLNNCAFSLDGEHVSIKQHDLAVMEKQLVTILFRSIDKVLK